MEFLRIDTTNLGGPKQDDDYHHGLLTPLPSATEGRRSSIESSQWQFGSYSGSVSSLEMSQGPSTPTSVENTTSGNYCVAGSNMSLDGYVFVPPSLGLKSTYESVPVAAPCTPVTPTERFGGHHDHDWSWGRKMDDSVHTPSFHSMMSRDLGSSFESTMSFGSHSSMTTYDAPTSVGSMSSDQGSASVPSNSLFYYGQSSESNGFHGVPIYHLRQPFTVSDGLLGTTVAPTETFVEQADQESMSMEGLAELEQHYSRSKLESRSSSPEDFDGIKMEDDPEYTPSRRTVLRSTRSMYESSTGGKRVRKEKRRSARSRRRHETQHMEGYLLGGKVDVRFDGDFKTTEDGKLIPTRKETKMHDCKHIFVGGRRCTRSFARIEHLKRHQYTHGGEKPFVCPMKAGCKSFNRNDNLQAHYQTHLLPAKAGRNERYTFEQVFACIRAAFPPEQADKSISTLCKWRDSGKYAEQLVQNSR